MSKRYVSNDRHYCLNIALDGHPYQIRFRDVGNDRRYGIYSTNSPAVADALEKDGNFGKYFFLEGGCITEKVEEVKPRVYDQTYPVKRTQDAIKILVEIYGVDETTIKKKSQVLEKADELNISFPEL